MTYDQTRPPPAFDPGLAPHFNPPEQPPAYDPGPVPLQPQTRPRPPAYDPGPAPTYSQRIK